MLLVGYLLGFGKMGSSLSVSSSSMLDPEWGSFEIQLNALVQMTKTADWLQKRAHLTETDKSIFSAVSDQVSLSAT